MRLNKYARLLGLSISFLVVMFSFQNCGEVKFKKNAGQEVLASNAEAAIVLNDLTVFEGEPAQLKAIINQSADNPSFIWMKNGAILEGVGDDNLSKDSVALDDQGLYEVIYLDGSAELGRAQANLTVIQQFFDTMPEITTQPSNKSLTVGDKLELKVVATGDPAPSYQWEKNGYSISGANSATYTVSKAALSHGGDYRVVVTNSAGSVQSRVVSVVISNAAPDRTCAPKSPVGYYNEKNKSQRAPESASKSKTTTSGLYMSCKTTVTYTCIAGSWVKTGQSTNNHNNSTICR